jgi:hypothetical protein
MKRKVFLAILVPLAWGGLAAAMPSAAEAAPACAVRDAPLSLNPIPASNDCARTLTREQAIGTDAVSPRALLGTTLSSTPLSYSRTNGDILTIGKIDGAAIDEIAIGGNFSAVITPDGVSHAAKNFAVLNETTGAVLYAGNANSYVRAIASSGGTIYAGGDFTAFAGVTRHYLVALNAAFQVTPWNPATSARVRALAADPTGVYYGGNLGSVRKANLTAGSTIWSKTVSGGGVASMLLNGDDSALYVGGLFEAYGGLTQHGLIEASTATGVPDPAFNAHLRADSGIGIHGSYDGESGKSLVLSPDGVHLVVGIAGYGADEVKVLNRTTGVQFWKDQLPGDCQAVAVVADTYVVGYHRNQPNRTVPYPYFSAQLAASNGALTNWDPQITGNQSNADGGNNGVQAMYADEVRHVLFLAGAFTMYRGAHAHQSLIAFSFVGL